ncbi:MAG: hypothetical protein KDB23_12825 [Planctomycetales bacterium]|nr:hypothetical protein [Planctomycetales bacterium]
MITRQTRLPQSLLLWTAILLASSGCTRSPYAAPYGTPYGTPYPGAPWGTPAPGAAPTLPPPQATPGAALPSVPALPPPGGATVPGASAYGVAPNGGVSMPDWSNPGTMAQQQQRANTFDPYADNNAAPEIVGGRPREFQKPLADPVRQRGFRDTRWPF